MVKMVTELRPMKPTVAESNLWTTSSRSTLTSEGCPLPEMMFKSSDCITDPNVTVFGGNVIGRIPCRTASASFQTNCELKF